MDGKRFDQLARALAHAPGSRRSLLRRFAAAALGGTSALAAAAAASADNDKGGNGNQGGNGGNGNQGGKGNGDKGPACRGAGHPCEGNQVCCTGLVCERSGPGAALRCTQPAAQPCAECESGATGRGGTTVTETVSYQVQVSCHYAGQSDQTTCTCKGVAGAGGQPVRRVTVPVNVVCGEVVGGSFQFAASAASAQGAGYVSQGSQGTVTLVLSGNVTTGGTATYWCTTSGGVFPATGPRFVTQPPPAAATSGGILVQKAACNIATPQAGFDWHGQCSQAAGGAAFSLAMWDGTAFVPAGSGTTAPNGQLSFGQLKPGTYQLKETSGQWCHAESDSVDAKGQVIVKAGQRATVWIFNCASNVSK